MDAHFLLTSVPRDFLSLILGIGNTLVICTLVGVSSAFASAIAGVPPPKSYPNFSHVAGLGVISYTRMVSSRVPHPREKSWRSFTSRLPLKDTAPLGGAVP